MIHPCEACGHDSPLTRGPCAYEPGLCAIYYHGARLNLRGFEDRLLGILIRRGIISKDTAINNACGPDAGPKRLGVVLHHVR